MYIWAKPLQKVITLQKLNFNLYPVYKYYSYYMTKCKGPHHDFDDFTTLRLHDLRSRSPRLGDLEAQGFLPVRFAAPLCMYNPVCTPVYPYVLLCTPVYPCVPLCTPMYPCVLYCTPVYITPVYPCVQYPCVPVCTPCVPVCTPCAPMCTPVCPCVPPCTHVYPCVLYPADPFVHLCTPVCAHVYPCVSTVSLCTPFVYPCDPPAPLQKEPPPPYLSSSVLPRATPTSAVYPSPNRGEGGLPAAPLTLGVWVLARFSQGGGRFRGTWSWGDASARLRRSGFCQKKGL